MAFSTNVLVGKNSISLYGTNVTSNFSFYSLIFCNIKDLQIKEYM